MHSWAGIKVTKNDVAIAQIHFKLFPHKVHTEWLAREDIWCCLPTSSPVCHMRTAPASQEDMLGHHRLEPS